MLEIVNKNTIIKVLHLIRDICSSNALTEIFIVSFLLNVAEPNQLQKRPWVLTGIIQLQTNKKTKNYDNTYVRKDLQFQLISYFLLL